MSYINTIDIMDIEGFFTRQFNILTVINNQHVKKLREQFRKQISFPFVITYTIGWNVMIRDNSND